MSFTWGPAADQVCRRRRPRGRQDRDRVLRRLPLPARTARPGTRRGHDRTDRRDAGRALRARGAQAGGWGAGRGATPSGRGPGSAKTSTRWRSSRKATRGRSRAGRRYLDAGRRAGAAGRRGGALRPRRLPGPRRIARRGAAHAPRRGTAPGAQHPDAARRALAHRGAARPGEVRQRLPHPPRRRPATGGGDAARTSSGCTPRPVVVHSCAPDVPFALLRRAGAAAVSFDFSLLTERDDDVIGEAVEGGTRLFAGVVPGTGRTVVRPCR